MSKQLRMASYVCAAMLWLPALQAQIKGDPVFNAVPQPLNVQQTNSRLSPELIKLYGQTPGAKAVPGTARLLLPNDAMTKYLQLSGNSIVVDITLKENTVASRAALQKTGLEITGVYGRVVSGRVPVDALPQLETIQSIQFVKPAYQPMHNFDPGGAVVQQYSTRGPAGPAAAPVISQGDTAQRSYLARKKYNVTGKGVKVGILSDSYDNLGTAAAGIAQGELPGPANPFNWLKPVEILQDLTDGSGTDEGRAMAEIVHDVAPGAKLAFHTAFAGEANFAQGIQDLVNSNCNIIVDDIAYLDEPFFQDGIIAQSVDLAKKKGVAYFAAAGNNHTSSYESDYRSTTDEVLGPGNGTAHNFSGPDAAPRYYQPIYIPPGGSFVASFQWDQPCFSAGGAGAASDLNIYLIDIYGNIVASAVTNNIISGDPIEIFGYDNKTPNYTFFIVIVKRAGPDPGHLKYILYRQGQFYVTNPAIPGIQAASLVGHAKAAGAITTGAAFYRKTPAYGMDTAQVEWFSSVGGVANYFDNNGNRIDPITRKKPDIIAPDGVNTSFFDPRQNADIPEDADSYPNFFGTSAAAPHAAGVAALMIEAEKLHNLTPAQIKGLLSANTADMDDIHTPGFDKGFDFNTGYGLIKADDAVKSVKFPNLYVKNLTLLSLCSLNPATTRIWKIINPNPFEVATHWLLLGTSQHGDILAPAGESYFPTNTFSFGNYAVPNLVILDWQDNFGFTRLDIKNSISAPCGSASGRTMATEMVADTLPIPLVAAVYPNPSTGVFRVYLALPDPIPIDLQLFSIDGRLLLQKHVLQTKGIVPIDAAAYKPGVYLLLIKQGAFTKTIKLVKQ